MDHAGFGGRIEGIHAVAAALARGRVARLTIDQGRLDHPDVARLMVAAEDASVEVLVVDDIAGLAETDSPQGVVAEASPIPWVDLEEAVAATEPPALLVLDHLEDPRNVGACARSAFAAGIGALVVSGRRAAPLGPTALKAAAGAFEGLRVATVSSIPEAMSRLRRMGVWLVGLTPGGDQSLFGLELLAEPVAIVVGAEGRGLSRLVEERLDARVRIGHGDQVESLNASVAAALGMFEMARVRGWVT